MEENNTNRVFAYTPLLAGCAALVLAGVLVYVVRLRTAVLTPQYAAPGAVVPVGEQHPWNKELFSALLLEARAAYVLDLSSNTVLFAKNAELQLPLASLTKLMTALMAYELLPQGGRVPITAQALAAEGESGLIAGEEWDTRSLINFMLISSSNDGAEALATYAATLTGRDTTLFMNEKASVLGLRQSYFSNGTGLDRSVSESGSYGSARDMAHLMAYLVTHHPELLAATAQPSMSYQSTHSLHFAQNTNMSLAQLPGVIASKTGYTELAGGNLVIAFDRGLAQPVVVVVLGSSREGRFRDVEALVRTTLAAAPR